MMLLLGDLPHEVQEAYLASDAKSYVAESIQNLSASAVVEAVLVFDYPNAIVYSTRDGGKSFKAERIAETVRLRGEQSADNGIAVRLLVDFSTSDAAIQPLTSNI